MPGPQHDVNQDSLLWQDDRFWGVADGVGGGAHGEVASRLLLDFMACLPEPSESDIQEALREADRRIDAQIRSLGNGPGAAVMACLWAQPDPSLCLAAWVGDCQVLHLRREGGRWRCLWASPPQTYEHAGLQPPPGIPADSPANMVGCGLSAPAQAQRLTVRRGDRLVVCSDGFASLREHPQVARLLAAAPRSLAPGLASEWCEAARRAGGQDDITVLVLQRQASLTRLARVSIAGAAVLAAAASALVWSLL